MGILGWLFGRGGGSDVVRGELVVPMARTRWEGEDLTGDEVRIFREALSCPDCGERKLLVGPEGGGCVNVYCGNAGCGSRFNEMGVCGIQRITDAGPDRPRVVPEGPYAYR